jgi:hypothetical protein
LVAGSAICIRLKIQKTGYRLLHSANNSEKAALVLIDKLEAMPSNEIKGSYHLIRHFGQKITLSRINLGLHTICNTLLPKIA